MKQPKKTKYRRHQKGRLKGLATRGFLLEHGTCGLKADEPVRVTARQLEAGRIVINRFLKREGKVYIRVFPDLSVSKKPAEVRMGSGKGSPEYWAARVYPGTIVYEVQGVDYDRAEEALRKASRKMPFKGHVVRADKLVASLATV